jgi:hypothetical protein
VARSQAQLGDSPALKQARINLAQARSSLDGLAKEQRETESAVSDLSAKMAAANESLFSGRSHNPKELQNLQQDLGTLRAPLAPTIPGSQLCADGPLLFHAQPHLPGGPPQHRVSAHLRWGRFSNEAAAIVRVDSW